MESFNQLLKSLDQTTSTLKKVESLKCYFTYADPEDACWALFLISGYKIPTKINRSFIHEAFCEYMQIPMWLFKDSVYHVGDTSETIALLRGPLKNSKSPPALGKFVTQELLSLKNLAPSEVREKFFHWWGSFDESIIFLIHKCFSGNFRLGVSKNLLIQALSQVAGLEKDVMSFRLMGTYEPTPESYLNLMGHEITVEKRSKPYPYFLASPVDEPDQTFKSWEEWCVEWKWDGIRAQIIKREGEVFLWSRGEELINESFPEVLKKGAQLLDGTVLDGELLPFKNNEVLSFSNLQMRLNRKKITKKDLEKTPISIMVYDVLEWEGKDVRELSLRERKNLLNRQDIFPVSEILDLSDLTEAKEKRLESREMGVEGFMLKRWSSPYQSGRKRGDWWKWKIDPMTIDCVLLYAQPGTGRRSGLFTDYTLAVWDKTELVPITKAYSGLSDDELVKMDHWIKKNTQEKFGPVRSVTPHHVFEIAFEGIQESKRHKAGVALRFPRIQRWRHDKKPEEADTLENVRKLIHER